MVGFFNICVLFSLLEPMSVPSKNELITIGDVVSPDGIPNDLFEAVRQNTLLRLDEGEVVHLTAAELETRIIRRVPALKKMTITSANKTYMFKSPANRKNTETNCVKITTDIEAQASLGEKNAKNVKCGRKFKPAPEYVVYRSKVDNLQSIQPIPAGVELGPLHLIRSASNFKGEKKRLSRTIGRITIEKDITVERSSSGNAVLVRDTSGKVFETKRRYLENLEPNHE